MVHGAEIIPVKSQRKHFHVQEQKKHIHKTNSNPAIEVNETEKSGQS